MPRLDRPQHPHAAKPSSAAAPAVSAVPSGASVLLWFVAYVATGALALKLQPANAPALWYPPVAIGAALLTRRGLRLWPLVLLADAIVSSLQYHAPLAAGVVAISTLLEALLVAAVLRHMEWRTRLRAGGEAVLTLLAAALFATLIGATLGSLATLRFGLVSADRAFADGLRWWLGDATSLIALLPALLLWPEPVRELRETDAAARWMERIFLFTVTGALAVLLFGPLELLARAEGDALLVLMFIPVLWAALRFGIATTAFVALWGDSVAAVCLATQPGGAPATGFAPIAMQIAFAVTSLGGLALAGTLARERDSRRAAEHAAAEMLARESHLQLAVRAGQIASFEWRESDGSLRWSDSMYELLGLPPRSVMPDRELWLAHVRACDRDASRARFLANSQRIGPFAYEQILEFADGRHRFVAVRGETLIVDGERRMLGIAQDVTALHQARLLDSELAAVVANSDDAILTIAPDGEIRSWNAAAERIFGYPAAQAVGRSKTMVVPLKLAGEFQSGIAAVLNGERIAARETVRLHADGRELQVIESLSPVRDPSGRIVAVAAILRDIGVLRGLEAQLRQAQKMEAVGRLAGGIAHDFNNMLTAILGFSDLLDLQLPETSPAREEVQQIRRAGERAALLTRQLLAFSRRQAQRPEPVRWNDVVHQVEPMLKRLLADEAALVIRLDAVTEPVFADPVQLEQVLLNLVINARDAILHEGTITIEARTVDLDADALPPGGDAQPGRFTILSVSDTGIGMDAETRARIFEPFFTTKEPGRGTGLGLSTVFGIVRQGRGAIWVFSEPGRGTTFRIALPVVGAEHASPAPETRQPIPLGDRETILVVEDDVQVLEFVRQTLMSAGYEVLSASHPQEGTALLRAHLGAIDLLLTDVVMPRLHGGEVARIGRRLRPEMPVLFMSGFSEHSFGGEPGIPASARMMPKPFSRETLLREVREALDAEPAADPAERRRA